MYLQKRKGNKKGGKKGGDQAGDEASSAAKGKAKAVGRKTRKMLEEKTLMQEKTSIPAYLQDGLTALDKV